MWIQVFDANLMCIFDLFFMSMYDVNLTSF